MFPAAIPIPDPPKVKNGSQLLNRTYTGILEEFHTYGESFLQKRIFVIKVMTAGRKARDITARQKKSAFE